MSRDSFGSKAFYLLVSAIAFAMPLHARIVPVLIGLLLISWIIEGNFASKFRSMRTHSIALLPALLFLLYLTGMIYSYNKPFGLRDLETKLSLFIFPLLLPGIAAYSYEQVKRILYWFVIGCILSCFICLGWAVYSILLESHQVKLGIVRHAYVNTGFFFGSRLSVFLHPSYFAMYLCFAVVLLIRELLLNRNTKKRNTLIVLVILVFSVMIFMLASKLGMILLVLTWFAAAGWIIVRKRKVIAGLVTIVAFALGALLLYKYSAIVASRIDYTIAAFNNPVVDKSSTESSTVRRLIWNEAKELIASHPMGVGTGDSKDALLAKYRVEGLTGALEKNLNAHNQYLQTAVAIGWPGLLVLVLSMLALLARGIRSKDTETWSLALILLISFITESMLETQAGVVFFGFFIALFAYRNFSRKPAA